MKRIAPILFMILCTICSIVEFLNADFLTGILFAISAFLWNESRLTNAETAKLQEDLDNTYDLINKGEQ